MKMFLNEMVAKVVLRRRHVDLLNSSVTQGNGHSKEVFLERPSAKEREHDFFFF